MSEALINQEILLWAAQRADIPTDVLAERLHVQPEKIEIWLQGAERPTFRQAQNLASVLHIPFGFLFLPRPPVDDLPIPDLRTVDGNPTKRLDTNFKDLLNDILFKRDWYKEFLHDHADVSLPFVGKFGLDALADSVASDIRATLLGTAPLPPVKNSEEFLRFLMQRAEEVGIWVMRSGIVGSNTHRALSVEQFRGFAISDPMVPLVFINGKDAKAAQLFTLVHELAHIWLGQSGVSNVMIGENDYGVHRRVEKLCNQIAAEFLVPRAAFADRWNASLSFISNVDSLASYFKVSRIVIARRALDLEYVSQSAFGAFYQQEKAKWESASSGDGGNFYLNVPIRNGAHFTRSVLSQAMSGRMLRRHAASLLNTQPAAVVKLHQRQSAA